MSYEVVKQVLNKVLDIFNSIKDLENADLASRLGSLYTGDVNNKDEMIQWAIRNGLTSEEYDIYIKYCQYYRMQKQLEYGDVVSVLSTQIKSLTDLYDKRQRTLGDKSTLERKRGIVGKSVNALPWEHFENELAKLMEEHSRYWAFEEQSILSGKREGDGIYSPATQAYLARKRRENGALFTRSQSNEFYERKKEVKQRKAAQLRDHIDFYLDTMKDIILEALKNREVLEAAIKSTKLIVNGQVDKLTEEEQVGCIIDSVMDYAVQEKSRSDATFKCCYYDDDIPRNLAGGIITVKEYMMYFLQFLYLGLDDEISKCLLEANKMMIAMKIELEKQKQSIAQLNDDNGQFIIDSNMPTEEEKNIFSLVYKELKK